MFHLVEITSYADSTPPAKGVYDYETEIETLAKFHKKLGGAMDNENYATELVVVMDEKGNIIAKDYFARHIEPQVTPEPEPEPELEPEES